VLCCAVAVYIDDIYEILFTIVTMIVIVIEGYSKKTRLCTCTCIPGILTKYYYDTDMEYMQMVSIVPPRNS